MHFKMAVWMLGLCSLCSLAHGEDSLNEELRGFLPQEYITAFERVKNNSAEEMVKAFPTRRQQADCRNGIRIFTQFADSLVARLKPSCADLLNPIGTEWLPQEDEEFPEAFQKCGAPAWSRRVILHVYDTALACSWEGLESVLMAAQLEYNRCFKEILATASFGVTFIEDPWQPGTYALIPADDERWDSMLRGIRQQYGRQQGILTMACEIAKVDAESGRAPRNILQSGNGN